MRSYSLSSEHYIATTAPEAQEQANKTAYNYSTHKLYPRWSVSHSFLAIFTSHVDIPSLYRGIFYSCVSGLCSSEDFVQSRFVIPRTSLYRGLLNPGPTE